MENNINEEIIASPTEQVEINGEAVIEGVKETFVEETPVEEIQIKTGIVIPNHLNVRNEANKDSSIIGIINKDDTVKIISELNDFYQIQTNMVEGFCLKEFIKLQ